MDRLVDWLNQSDHDARHSTQLLTLLHRTRDHLS